MTPHAAKAEPTTNTVVRCQHCYCNLVNIKGHWLDGKTRSQHCLPLSSGNTIPHKPLPKV
jgi:hypothetical protein